MANRGVKEIENTDYDGGVTENKNQIRVQIGGLELWFSYQTLVAFRIAGGPETKALISENQWGATTGQHIAKIRRATGGVVLSPEAFEFLAKEIAERINAALRVGVEHPLERVEEKNSAQKRSRFGDSKGSKSST
jgi:hypothetical protein